MLEFHDLLERTEHAGVISITMEGNGILHRICPKDITNN